jgi:2-amino-4-hydroxy-6-hydroxymethyldihydropteridine diphosphokinase
LISEEPDLTLPHPHIAERPFVLVPLADIAPDLVVGGKRVRDWLAKIDHKDVVALD